MSASQPLRPDYYAREFNGPFTHDRRSFHHEMLYVYSGDGSTRLYKGLEVPVCGEDFCDTCGDCMHCFGDDPCFQGGEVGGKHYWVKYDEGLEGAYCLWEPGGVD